MNINLNLVGGAAIGGAFALPVASLPVWAATSAAPAPGVLPTAVESAPTISTGAAQKGAVPPSKAPTAPSNAATKAPPRGSSAVFEHMMGLANGGPVPPSAVAPGQGELFAEAGDPAAIHDSRHDNSHANKLDVGHEKQPDAPQEGAALPAMAMPLLVWLMPQHVPAPPAGAPTTDHASTNSSTPATAKVRGTGSVAAATGIAAANTSDTAALTNEAASGPPAALAPVTFSGKPAPAADSTAADERPALSQAASAAPSATTPMSVPPSAPWNGSTNNPPPLTLAGSGPAWQRPLQDALGDQLQLQLGRNSDRAVIRLDPPDLGRIDITIRQGNGTLQVNLSASNGDVLRQLHAIGDSLRQDLAQRGSGDVAVQITASAPSPVQRGAPTPGYADGDGRQRQPQPQAERADTPGRALDDGADDTAPNRPRYAMNRQQ